MSVVLEDTEYNNIRYTLTTTMGSEGLRTEALSFVILLGVTEVLIELT